ncbi:unnamed protein product [Coregonus sp. 'balchen']|nr:unnamed protein product [Coregonus sp. 'balchen']
MDKLGCFGKDQLIPKPAVLSASNSHSDMSALVGEGRVIAQRVTRSITYYYTSRKPGGDTPPPSPPTISPNPLLSSHLDTPLPHIPSPPPFSQTRPLTPPFPQL